MDERYYKEYALACARGALLRMSACELPTELIEKELWELTDSECERIFDLAKEKGVKLYHFKKSDRMLPRVHKVLGFLKGVRPESLVDVGSGRGVFLLPLLEELPYISVTSLDILEKRITMLNDIKNGGISRLSVLKADICQCTLEDKCADAVTMLEVLEHIPDTKRAVSEAVRIARKYIVVTVPSKKDDNPEHIHLLTKERLTEVFCECGVTRLTFDGVPGHLFMIARL